MPDPARNLLVVEAAGRRVGLLAENVQEVHAAVTVTPLPGAPAVVEGIVNVRGRIVPVVGLRRRLDLPPAPVRPSDALVLLDRAGTCVALRVDDALGFSAVDREDLVPALALPGAAYVAGAAVEDDGLLVVLDAARFLTLDERSALDDALSARSADGRA